MTAPSDELKQARSKLLSLFSSGEAGESFQAQYTEIVDEYFRRSVQESEAFPAMGVRLKASMVARKESPGARNRGNPISKKNGALTRTGCSLVPKRSPSAQATA
jgi:hypothetical protein